MGEDFLSNGFDFDQEVNREESGSAKYDGRQDMFGKKDIIPVWVADMDFAAPPAVTRALTERATHPIYGYTLFPDSLYDALIDWMQRRHGCGIKRDWVVMCPGIVPSLYASVMGFTQLGESVIIQPPVYSPFFSAITQTGRKLTPNPLLLENGRYTIDFDHLESCMKRARLLLLCSPHNPVGRVWQQSELERLLELAARNKVIIFSDEIHADLVYPGNRHHTLAIFSEKPARVITAIAPSKTFNIPGLNLAALIIPDSSIRDSITKVFDTLHVSVSNPFNITAFETAYLEGEAWLEALLIYLRDTRDNVEKFLSEQLPEIKVIKAEGTYLLWLDCRSMDMTNAQLEHFFIHEAGVGMNPGTQFGTEGGGFMRLNIGAPRQTIMKVLRRIHKARVKR